MNEDQLTGLKEQLTTAQEALINLEKDRPRIESDFLQANETLEDARNAHRNTPNLDSVTSTLQKQLAARSILEMIDGEILTTRGTVNGLKDQIGQIEALEQLKQAARDGMAAGKTAHAKFDNAIKGIWDAIHAARDLEKSLAIELTGTNAIATNALNRLAVLEGLEPGLQAQIQIAARLGGNWQHLHAPTWPANTQISPLKG